MTDEAGQKGFSLRRWSQRKLAAGRDDAPGADDGARASASSDTLATASAPASPGRDATPASPPAAPVANASMTPTAHRAALAGTPATSAGAKTEPIPLPPLESLTIDSDFSPFMQPGVDEELKRSALRKLLRDPHFNVMDGLDVYIDDYSKPSPLEPELARTLAQARYLFNPPKTRVTAEGIVEDVPDDADIAGETLADDTVSANALPAVGVSEVPAPDMRAARADEEACELPSEAEAELHPLTPSGVSPESDPR